MFAMDMHEGCLETSKKGFEQGEWPHFDNCDQTIIGLILAKSTSRGSEAHIKTSEAPWLL